jgi:hypothetical protein
MVVGFQSQVSETIVGNSEEQIFINQG